MPIFKFSLGEFSSGEIYLWDVISHGTVTDNQQRRTVLTKQ